MEDTEEVREMKQAIENQRMNVNRATNVKVPSSHNNELMRLDPNNLSNNQSKRQTTKTISQRGAANDQ